MADGGTERSEFDVPMPVPVGSVPVMVPTTIGMDNIYRGHTPESLTDGVQTQVDAASLDSAISWLESYASYLNNTSYDISDIKELMGEVGGGAGGKGSPLGGFPWAVELAGKHSSLYATTETALRSLSNQLYEAADALRKVKENYQSAEGANKMSAADMRQAFADVARHES